MADKNEDASDEYSKMQSLARKQARWAIQNLKIQYKMSEHIKKKFDDLYGHHWNCVVGKSFGFYVSFQPKTYFYFYEGKMAILLYKIQ